MHLRTHLARTALVTLTAAVALTLGAAGAASAHVTLAENQAAPGSFPLLELKVPNESATAVTDRVQLTIPQDTPFAYVSYVPVPGWSAELTSIKLGAPIISDDGTLTDAVTRVTWTADAGTGLTPGQLGLFTLSVGPVPETGSIVLAVSQGYSDATTVDWNETTAGAEHPAPVLYVTDAPPAGEQGADDAAPTVAATGSGAPASDAVARGLGIAGLVLGAVAVVIAVTGRRGATR